MMVINLTLFCLYHLFFYFFFLAQLPNTVTRSYLISAVGLIHRQERERGGEGGERERERERERESDVAYKDVTFCLLLTTNLLYLMTDT